MPILLTTELGCAASSEQDGEGASVTGRFVRLGELDRAHVAFSIDGRAASGFEGDSLLVAVLNQAESLRISEFGDGPRAGFCLMGACQDCWMWTEDGERLRACTTLLTQGLRVVTKRPDQEWLKAAS